MGWDGDRSGGCPFGAAGPGSLRRGRMLVADTRPVLYVVGCGGRPAGHLPAFVRFAQGQGWDVCVIATPDGAKFLDAPDLAGLTGHPVRVQYKRPEEPDVLRRRMRSLLPPRPLTRSTSLLTASVTRWRSGC
jgi:hypothetical protein